MFEARVYNVFIASPGDAAELREIAREVIHQWNDRNADALGVVLLPKMWEKNTAPGNAPAQEIINREALDGSDLVIAVWRYLWGAGTEEEVERSIRDNSREVMQYFSVEPVPRQYVGDERQQKLLAYQEKMTTAGETYYCIYRSPEDFRQVLAGHLELKVHRLMAQTKRLDVGDFSPAELELLSYAVNASKIVYRTDGANTGFATDVYSTPNFYNTFPGDGQRTGEEYRRALAALFAKGVLVNPAGKSEMDPLGGVCRINSEKRGEIESVVLKAMGRDI